MKHITKEELKTFKSRYRANLINSCTGYKSCNLLGTVSSNEIANLAIFNSVVHLGSNPPMLGFILRPLTVRRDTYANFKESGFFTVNQVHSNIVQDAHHTSAKYEVDVSEFSKTKLTEEYLHDFPAPYVKESALKIGCRYVNEYTIAENDCLLVIGAIEHLYLPEETLHKDGWVQLDKMDTIATIGLDGYALPKLLHRFAYARPNETSEKLESGT